VLNGVRKGVSEQHCSQLLVKSLVAGITHISHQIYAESILLLKQFTKTAAITLPNITTVSGTD
jgi:hypothetical protein